MFPGLHSMLMMYHFSWFGLQYSSSISIFSLPAEAKVAPRLPPHKSSQSRYQKRHKHMRAGLRPLQGISLTAQNQAWTKYIDSVLQFEVYCALPSVKHMPPLLAILCFTSHDAPVMPGANIPFFILPDQGSKSHRFTDSDMPNVADIGV